MAPIFPIIITKAVAIKAAVIAAVAAIGFGIGAHAADAHEMQPCDPLPPVIKCVDKPLAGCWLEEVTTN